MENTLDTPLDKPGLASRCLAYPLVRIVLGILLTFAWVPLVMIAASTLVDKPYRIVWPQLLAAALVWFGYRCYVRRIDKRQPAELALPGMPRQLGLGLLIGAGLVILTFATLAALGVYRFDGVGSPGLTAMLVPLAELLLVGMAEEMVFRGIIFGVTRRALGTRAAIVISALAFSLAHLPNDGVSLLAMAVIAAYAVMQAALYMTTRTLWACIGTHVAWNYCVGQLFSSTVSGHAGSGGLLRGELVGNTMLTGGAFGVEASLVALLLIGGAAAVLLRRSPSSPRT
ncbi:CPBP family intramembrane metalloprotease [Massilia atriviolacea]|uniref:CPBP family intramembrane metalloprotease n=1 Tax=Massilia atriviolacea TaxID=2495579 RepID=A0A430HTM8_9BURK|nr:type II CAAX endopeptidase family protein [Massilia atriviolacea]RSZ60842.1 CPBP family intramembrane metalloprotease [Massilia atriviolacea]